MGWIKFSGVIDKGRYIVCTSNGVVTEMRYNWNMHAKTEKGRIPRWEWNGKISPWTVTHYMPLPAPPED